MTYRHESWIDDLRRKPIVPGALLVLATLLLYGPVTHHEFINYFDDDFYVTQNAHVNTGLNLDNVIWAFGFHEANWHPLTWLSHMADCQMFGLSPGPHHFVNLVLHAGNVLLLFWLLQRATSAVWRSFLVAALFAVHPLNVETVAWVAERKSLLCTFFSLITIAAYGSYVRSPNWKRYLVIVATFSLALMSKPVAVSLPLVLLLLDYWPLERYKDLPRRVKWQRLTMEKLPLLLLSAASSMLTLAAQSSVGAIPEASVLSLSVRLENAIESYVAYIEKMLWPANLAVFYPHPWHSLPWPQLIVSIVILALVTAAAVHFRSARYFSMGWLFFLITLIPMIGIVQVGRQAMADRYAYVPCIGLFIIVAWGFGDLLPMTRVPRIASGLTALCLVSGLAIVTSFYLPYWQNGVELFERARAVAIEPDFMIEEGLAENLDSAGRFDEALSHYQKACLLNPNYARCREKMEELVIRQRFQR